MDVRMPDGTIVKNVPEGTTKAQLMEKLNRRGLYQSGPIETDATQLGEPATLSNPTPLARFRQQYPQYDDMSDNALAQALHGKFYADMPYDQFLGKIGLQPGLPERTGPRDLLAGSPPRDLLAENNLVPSPTGDVHSSDYQFPVPEQSFMGFMGSEEAAPLRKFLPVAGAVLAPLTGGSSLYGAAALSGLGAAGGELASEYFGPENVDPNKVLREGFKAGAGSLIGGAIFKTLLGAGASASDDAAQAAMRFAEKSGAPLPPLTARGRIALVAGRAPVLGEVAAARQASKIGDVISNEIRSLSGTTSSADDAVTAARTMLADKLQARSGYEKIIELVGDDTIVPLTKTRYAIQNAIPELAKTGNDDLTAHLKTIAEAMSGKTTALPFDRVNGLLVKIYKTIEPANRRVADEVVGAIKSDIERAVLRNPQLAARLQQSGKDISAFFSEAGAQQAFVRRFLKDAPEVRQMLRGGTSQQFLVKFSTSEKTRELLKAIDQDAHDQLAKAWLGSNLERLRASDNLSGFFKFVADHKPTIQSMFGKAGSEAVENFAAYLKYADDFAKTGKLEALARNPAALAGRLYGEFHMMGPVGVLGAEGGGWLLVNSLLKPGGLMYQLFTKGLPESTLGSLGAAVGAPAGMNFEEINRQFSK